MGSSELKGKIPLLSEGFSKIDYDEERVVQQFHKKIFNNPVTTLWPRKWPKLFKKMNPPLTLDLKYHGAFNRTPFEHRGPAPTMIDPSNIPRIISEGKYIMAITNNGHIAYVTSDHPDAIYLDFCIYKGRSVPFCTEDIPDWIQTTPWEHLSRMRVLKSGGLLVFVPYDMEEMSITTYRYRFLPRLHAVMIYGISSL